MPIITQIQTTDQKVNIYLDYKCCISIKPCVWRHIKLHEGSKITREELKKKEAFFWRKVCMIKILKRERTRVKSVAEWLMKYLSEVELKIIQHSDGSIQDFDYSRSAPDIGLFLKGTKTEIIAIKVVGTDVHTGTNCWIKMRAIEYAQKHSTQEIWIAAHFKFPKEEIIWIKPTLDKDYNKNIIRKMGNDKTNFVSFDATRQEYHFSSEFLGYMKKKIRQKLLKIDIH